MTWDRSIGPRCNIGPAEIERRRRTAIVFTVLAAAVAVVLLASHAPAVARLGLFPFAAGAAVAWAQVVHRFCVAFGVVGVENLHGIGEVERVPSERRAADLRRAAQLVLEGSALGAAITLALVMVPA